MLDRLPVHELHKLFPLRLDLATLLLPPEVFEFGAKQSA